MKEKIQLLIPENFSGCVLITKGAQTLFEGAYGFADMANERRNTLCTRFPTASAGKAFVAAGILRLAEEGKLSLDASIGECLPLDWGAIDASITVRELLTHTSGIPDYFDESVMDDYAGLWRDFPNYRIRSSRDLLPLFLHKPMAFPRGERFQYNNAGFVVLGLLIEQSTGLAFDTYLREAVFAPCGMKDTGYFELDRLPARCANAYCFDAQRSEYYTNIYSVDAKGTGAGGAFTTVLDVRRFWEGLYGGRILSPETLAEMTSLHAGDGKEFYGYGIWLERSPEGLTPYFEGLDPGVSFLSKRYRDGTIVTAVSNLEQNVWQLSREITPVLKQ